MTCGEIKLMVLGCPGIGKSTLVSWLKKEHHPTVSMDTSSTGLIPSFLSFSFLFIYFVLSFFV